MKQSIILTALLFLFLAGCGNDDEQEDGMRIDSSTELNDAALTDEAAMQESPHVVASNPIEAGRYLVIIGQCNDCHTDGYMTTENMPEEDWLTGSVVGWQGPWGTTYPPNLRFRVQEWSEDAWVQTLKTRKMMPPMPWVNVNKMSEQDMRAIYAYIQSLGPKGEHAPLAVAPGVMPSTQYLIMSPQDPPTTAIAQ